MTEDDEQHRIEPLLTRLIICCALYKQRLEKCPDYALVERLDLAALLVLFIALLVWIIILWGY